MGLDGRNAQESDVLSAKPGQPPGRAAVVRIRAAASAVPEAAEHPPNDMSDSLRESETPAAAEQ